jgi:hypothetical protein
VPVDVQPVRPDSNVPLTTAPLFGTTVRLNGTACVADGAVPVMVMPETLTGVAAEVVTVIREVPPAVTAGGLNVALAPDGRPLADSVTVSAEPSTTEVPTVVLAEPPAAVEAEGGLTDMVKSLPPLLAQPGSWKEAMRVCQLKLPVVARYSLAYQNVQPSAGSTTIEE